MDIDSDIGLSPMRAAGVTLPAGAHCSDGWRVATPWHHHDMHQLLYAFDGAVEVEGRFGRYNVPRQFAVWVPAGAVHRTSIQQVASGSVFLDPDMVPCEMSAPRVIPAPPLLREMVMFAMRWPFDRQADGVSEAFFACFAKLCTGWIGAEVRLVLPASSDERVAAIMDHTAANIASVCFEDVCRIAHMSPRTLRRRFKTASGISWEEYRLRQRMALALDALERTEKTVGQIAAEIGYENQAAFARTFRAITGIAPGEYRRR